MIVIILKCGLFIPIIIKIPCTAVNNPIKVKEDRYDLNANIIKNIITITVKKSGIIDCDIVKKSLNLFI